MAKTLKLSNLVRSRGTKQPADCNTISPSEYKEPTPIATRRVSKTRGPLTLTEKIDVIRMIKFELTPTAHVAKVFSTSVNVIAQLMTKVTKNPQHLRSLWIEH